MADYRHGGHTLTDIKYHVVWITKYRYQVLRGDIALRTRELLREICAAREVSIIRGAVAPDHVHMLVACPPSLGPSKLVQYLKGRSSRKLQEEFPTLRKRYWGQHLFGLAATSVRRLVRLMRKQSNATSRLRPGKMTVEKALKSYLRLKCNSWQGLPSGGFSHNATFSRQQT